MSMREKIIEAGVKWADEYDSSDPLQISKLADAIIAALREQEPVGGDLHTACVPAIAVKDARIAELEEESKEWNQRYKAQALLAQRLLKAGGCTEMVEELRLQRSALIAGHEQMRQQTIEECAKTCDRLEYVQADGFAKRYAGNRDLAEAIRALASDQQEPKP